LDKIEDFQGSDISTDMKNAALQAMEKLKLYYQKTDAAVFTVATLIDPCLKLFYHKEHKWEKSFINAARQQLKWSLKTITISHQWQLRKLMRSRMTCFLISIYRMDWI
jgi:hypothetical protein